MILQIEAHSGVPIYRQIMDQIRSQVLSGVIAPETQLPTVRQLASELQVNPMTISKAYSYLEIEGLLTRKRGIGLFVVELETSVKQEKQIMELRENLKNIAAQARLFSFSREEFVRLAGELYDNHEKNSDNIEFEGIDHE